MTSIEPTDTGRRGVGHPSADISLTVDRVTGDLMDALMAVRRVHGVGADGAVLTVEHDGATEFDVCRAVESVGVRVLDLGRAVSPLAERFIDEDGEDAGFGVDYRIWRRSET
jgi:hypothetical protein